ncbi:hypothetical protein J2X69_004127 [Algoriphagus sp. 4150]|nr:hypothetical protein [Algoriphagus sp. 4150]
MGISVDIVWRIYLGRFLDLRDFGVYVIFPQSEGSIYMLGFFVRP